MDDVSESAIFAGTVAREVMLEAGARSVQSTPLLSRSGRVLGMFSTHYHKPHRHEERELRLLDLLARQAADLIESSLSAEALRESERQFRQLAEVGPQIVWLSGPTGELEFVNQRWVEFSGLDYEATRKPEQIEKRLHPEDHLLDHWRKSVETGTPFELEARLRGKNGEFRWFMIRSVPLRDDEGRIVRWFGTSTDIHESKLMQLELKRANQDLEQFAYSASHDLQEPLRSIKIFSELLSDRYGNKLEGRALEFLGNVRASASRMEMLVRDLLAYTQASMGDKEPGGGGRECSRRGRTCQSGRGHCGNCGEGRLRPAAFGARACHPTAAGFPEPDQQRYQVPPLRHFAGRSYNRTA